MRIVLPQIFTLIILFLLIWLAYDNHSAFRELVDDIADYSGLSAEIKTADSLDKSPDAEQPDVVADDESSPESAEKENASGNQVVLQETVNQELTKSPMLEEDVPGPDTEAETTADQDNLLVNAAAELNEPDSPVESSVTPDTDTLIPDEPSEPQDVTEIEPEKQVTDSDEPDIQSTIDHITSGMVDQPDAQKDDMEARKQSAIEGLGQARQAWHQGAHDQAISIYTDYMREFQNHPDFAGELGNIFFSQGNTRLAVDAYTEAYIRLLRNRDFEKAYQVLRIIYNLDQERAYQLKESMNGGS